MKKMPEKHVEHKQVTLLFHVKQQCENMWIGKKTCDLVLLRKNGNVDNLCGCKKYRKLPKILSTL